MTGDYSILAQRTMPWRKFTPLVLFLTLLLSACTSALPAQPAGYVDLSNLQPLPTPANQAILPLRVAIAAVISPQGTAEGYAPLLEYLSQKLERPVERIQRRTYREINDLLRRGEVDLAFVCTSSYLIGKDQFGLELLVAPQVDGQTTYRAKMLVRAASPYDQLEDLRGQVFAFTDPTSFTGRAYPVYLLQQMGETPQTFFSRTFFTYSHDVAIRAVVDGLADGASVDSLVLDFALKREPQLASQIRVIHTSEAFGMPPVVVSPNLRPPLKAELRDLLLNMHLDAQGQAALAALGYERFVLVSDDDYQSARDILAQVRLEEATP